MCVAVPLIAVESSEVLERIFPFAHCGKEPKEERS